MAMSKKDKMSLTIGVGLAFLAWYLMRGSAPSLQWRVNPTTGQLEPAPYDPAADKFVYETGVNLTTIPNYISEAYTTQAPFADTTTSAVWRAITGTKGTSGSW